MAKKVMIYATGSDTALREMCWSLLQAGLASQADLLDRASIHLEDGDMPKIRWSGKVVTIICKRKQLEQVLAHMKRVYIDDDLAAYAVPVLASF